METHGHIGFEAQVECLSNKLGDLGVRLVKAERPQHDGQPRLLIADGAYPLLDVLDIVAKRHRARHEWFPHPVAQRLGVFRIASVIGENLERQIRGLVLHLRGLGFGSARGEYARGEPEKGFCLGFHGVSECKIRRIDAAIDFSRTEPNTQ